MLRHFLDSLVISSFLFQKKLNVLLIVAMHGALASGALRSRLVKYYGSPLTSDLFFYCLGRYLFYAVGNSNGIATIDISHSYIGLSQFQYYLTGALTLYNLLFTPLLMLGWANLYGYERVRLPWLVSAFHQLYGSSRQRLEQEPSLEMSLSRATAILIPTQKCDLKSIQRSLKAFLLFQMFYQVMVILSCFHFRNHLFVWSVFSPKIIVSTIHDNKI
jgi:ethanolaminephosphotransferase